EAGEAAQGGGEVLLAGDADGVPGGQGGADAVGPGVEFVVAEARGEPDPVKGGQQRRLGGPAVDHQPPVVGEQDGGTGAGERAGEPVEDRTGGPDQCPGGVDVVGVRDLEPFGVEAGGLTA